MWMTKFINPMETGGKSSFHQCRFIDPYKEQYEEECYDNDEDDDDDDEDDEEDRLKAIRANEAPIISLAFQQLGAEESKNLMDYLCTKGMLERDWRPVRTQYLL